MGTGGQLPKGFPEGMVISFTEKELESLKKNTLLFECFEQIKVVDEYPGSEPLQKNKQ